MAGGGSPGVVDGETPENRLVAIASYIAAGKRSEALAEIENLGGPFTDPEQLTRFMHLCLTLAGEELLDGNRTNGLHLIETCVYSGGPFGTASGEEDHPGFPEMDHRGEGCSRDKERC